MLSDHSKKLDSAVVLQKTKNQLDRLENKVEHKLKPLLQTIATMDPSEKGSLLRELSVKVLSKMRKSSKVFSSLVSAD